MRTCEKGVSTDSAAMKASYTVRSCRSVTVASAIGLVSQPALLSNATRSFRPAFVMVAGTVSGIVSTLSIVWITPPANNASCHAGYQSGTSDDGKARTAVTILETAFTAESNDTVPFFDVASTRCPPVTLV